MVSAQPLIAHAKSLEVQALNSDAVAVATLVEYTISADAQSIVDATFSVDDVIKGEMPGVLKIPLHLNFRDMAGWVEGNSRILIVRSGEPYDFTSLSDPELAVMRSDFSVLTDANSVVRAVRMTVLANPGVTSVRTMSLRVRNLPPKGFRNSGMGMTLEVPIDDRLQKWAVAMSSSKDGSTRMDAAAVLAQTKSDESIAILKGMLDDPQFGDYDRPNGNMGHGRGKHSVREIAYNALVEMGIEVEMPLIEKEYFDPDAVTFVYLERATNARDVVKTLGQFKNLKDLYLSNTPLTDEDMKVIADLRGVTKLRLDNIAISDAGLLEIGRMKGLTLLSLSGTKITDAGLRNLVGLRSLEFLDVSRTSVTGEGLRDVARLKTLKWLSIRATKVAIDDLRALKPLKSLGEIEPPPDYWKVGDDYLLALREAGLLHAFGRAYKSGDARTLRDDEVGTLMLYGLPIGDAGLAVLSDFKNLERMDLSGTRVTDEGMRTVARFSRLKSLNLNDTQVTDRGVRLISGMHNLTALALMSTGLTDDGLRSVEKLSELEWLVLVKTQITDDGLAKLSRLSKLKTLIIGDTRVTDAGLVHLMDMPALEDISLYGTQVTDTGLMELAKLKSLRKVNVWRTPGVTDAGLAKFRRLRPEVEIGR